MFFFFQAEDGIRDADVTGVQTCALPISTNLTKKVASILIARTSRRLPPPSGLVGSSWNPAIRSPRMADHRSLIPHRNRCCAWEPSPTGSSFGLGRIFSPKKAGQPQPQAAPKISILE